MKSVQIRLDPENIPIYRYIDEGIIQAVKFDLRGTPEGLCGNIFIEEDDYNLCKQHGISSIVVYDGIRCVKLERVNVNKI